MPVRPNSNKPAPNSIGTAELIDGAVVTNKLADSAVDTAKIADNAINTSKMADNGITTAKLAQNAVTLAKLDAAAARSQVSISENDFTHTGTTRKSFERISLSKNSVSSAETLRCLLSARVLSALNTAHAEVWINSQADFDPVTDEYTGSGSPDGTIEITGETDDLYTIVADISALANGKFVVDFVLRGSAVASQVETDFRRFFIDPV